MADKSVVGRAGLPVEESFQKAQTLAEHDISAAEKFNKQLEESLNREKKLRKQYYWRGNKLPPFSIEPMPHVRQRLAGAGMTDADRALRKQWLKDQELAPNEPRYVKELYPKNPIRRMLAAPWDALFKVLEPVIGGQFAATGRYIVPRLCITTALVWMGWYHLKYHPAEWTGKPGWNIYSSKPKCYPGDPEWPEGINKEASDFNDRGFKSRKVFT